MTSPLPLAGAGEPETTTAPPFAATLARHGLPPLRRARANTLQLNVGRLCNLACHHCHVEAGPRQREIMGGPVAARVLEVLAGHRELGLLDITGGAPEMNPHFENLVVGARRLGRQVIDRCNLTVFFEPGCGHLPELLAREQVHVVASLPCYTPGNVDRQRGRGTFDGSIEALRWLNRLGYGRPASPLALDLVYNPLGPRLPPPQAQLEADYRGQLRDAYGIEFTRLLTITNMPIRRFAATLAREGQESAYMSLLVNHFNAATVPGLMCRTLLSVDWEGRLYDCDFNQMLGLDLGASARTGIRTIFDLDSLSALQGRPIATGPHCHGCTAGAGSSCSGALA